MDSDITKLYKKNIVSKEPTEGESRSSVTDAYLNMHDSDVDSASKNKTITESYLDIYSEAKIDIKDDDDKSWWSGDIDDVIARRLIKHAEANEFYRHLPGYLEYLGYTKGKVPAAFEKYFVETGMAKHFASMFSQEGEGLPDLDEYVKHGNKISLRPEESGPLNKLFKGNKDVDLENFSSLVSHLWTSKSMPKKGQAIGNSEVVLLLFFKDTFQPGIGNVTLVGGEKGDIGIRDGKRGSYLLEVKDGMPRVGSGDAVYSGTVPSALMQRLFDGIDGVDDVPGRVEQIKTRVKENLKRDELKFRVLTNFNTQDASLIRMMNWIGDPVLPKDVALEDIYNDDESGLAIHNVFRHKETLNDLFNRSSGNANKVLDDLTLFDELSSELDYSSAKQLMSDILTIQSGVVFTASVDGKDVQKKLSKTIFTPVTAGKLLSNYTMTNDELEGVSDSINKKMESINTMQVTAGGTYGHFVTQYFNVLNSDDTTLYPGSPVAREKAIVDGLVTVRNYGNLAALETDEYSLTGDATHVLKEKGSQWIVDNLKYIVGAIHLISYQIDEKFDEILFFSNKEVGSGIFVSPKHFGQYRIIKLIEFLKNNNFKADLSIDSARPVGVHVWYN